MIRVGMRQTMKANLQALVIISLKFFQITSHIPGKVLLEILQQQTPAHKFTLHTGLLTDLQLVTNTPIIARVLRNSTHHKVDLILLHPISGNPSIFHRQDQDNGLYFSDNDGKNVYYADSDAFSTNAATWFVLAFKIISNDQYIFSSGSPYKTVWNTPYKSVIDQLNDVKGTVTGSAVQKSSSFLFVAHHNLNLIKFIQ